MFPQQQFPKRGGEENVVRKLSLETNVRFWSFRGCESQPDIKEPIDLLLPNSTTDTKKNDNNGR